MGDTIKHGRRGSLNGRLTVHGVQGHVAYPERTVNPIHGACTALADLLEIVWDEGSDDFPPTRFQVSNIRSGTGAVNVVPAMLEADFNFRYSPALDATDIRRRVESVLERRGLRWSIGWEHSAAPFITPGGRLVEAAKSAVREVSGIEPLLSTAGGTSDGRFVAPTGGGGDRARAGQRHDPPGRRAGGVRRPRPAEPDVRRDPRPAPRHPGRERDALTAPLPPAPAGTPGGREAPEPDGPPPGAFALFAGSARGERPERALHPLRGLAHVLVADVERREEAQHARTGHQHDHAPRVRAGIHEGPGLARVRLAELPPR